MSAAVPNFRLNNGTTIPAIGLGCWTGGAEGNQRDYDMCEKALKVGYRHIDTAGAYRNEKKIGEAVRASGIPRKEIYITTKLPNADHGRVREALEKSLAELDCEYIDLYLMHWPQAFATGKDGKKHALRPEESPTFVETYKEMEKLLETGKVKTLGVSNFSIKTLTQLLKHCKVVPAVNQVELHPCLPQEDLNNFCKEKGILLTAYTPLGRSSLFFEHPVVGGIAKKRNATVAQVLLSWGVQRGTSVVPKSEHEERLRGNLSLINLSQEDTKAIDNIHREPGMHRSLLELLHDPEGGAIGWTYEELGWNMTTGGIVPEGSDS